MTLEIRFLYGSHHSDGQCKISLGQHFSFAVDENNVLAEVFSIKSTSFIYENRFRKYYIDTIDFIFLNFYTDVRL